jgi:hypothetical protein
MRVPMIVRRLIVRVVAKQVLGIIRSPKMLEHSNAEQRAALEAHTERVIARTRSGEVGAA